MNTRNPDRSDSARSVLFDLDATAIDSVYQHGLAWRGALESLGTAQSVRRIHRPRWDGWGIAPERFTW